MKLEKGDLVYHVELGRLYIIIGYIEKNIIMESGESLLTVTHPSDPHITLIEKGAFK